MTTQGLNPHELLGNVNEYIVLLRLREKLQKLSDANNIEGIYDLSILESEVEEAEKHLYEVIDKARQFSDKYNASNLNKYTIITHHDYEDDSSIDLFVCENIIEDDFNIIQHILTDKVLKEGSSGVSSIDELCGDWIDYHLYLYYISEFKK